ncbi:uncharacterized protein LDX57_000132 [Aspergillus melleus]|uniref:uncharacterized protein n=1 Tax=Aspergillus melleus TaxID=138277 RepID=UPI001E8EAC3A|nr:uncharacterized protein LDX57_000132 [Aspergillus melleus]KAH8422376.1 hypothetical protein LDX57_000132 [Aspergillus melleus]
MDPGPFSDLPLYPWDHDQRYWNESRISREWRQPKFRHHEILGSRVVESTDSNPSWRNLLSTSSAGWITDHQLRGKIIFPGAGYVCMAGEAIRQISGSTDYTIRHLHIAEPLILPEESDVEVITSLSIIPFTNVENSKRFRFTVSSATGECWINHCTGEVQGGADYDLSDKRQLLVDNDSDRWNRTLESSKYYSSLRDIGHGYGPYFQLLSSLQASSCFQAAKGTIQMDNELYRTSYYAQHPLIIDHCLQLSIVAAIKGLCHRLDHLVVPASVNHIYVAPSQHEDVNYDLKAFATEVKKSAVCHSVAGSNGGMKIAISGRSMVSIINEIKPMEIQELHWHPIHASMRSSELINAPYKPKDNDILMEEIAVLCTLESARIAESQRPATQHIQTYKDWLSSQARIFRSQGSKLVPQARVWATGDSSKFLDMIQKRAALAEQKLDPWQYQLILRVFENSLTILTEDKDSLDFLFEGTSLREFYQGLHTLCDCSTFLSSLGHEQPGLKVLEVGGGTGGFTTHVLESLKGASKAPLYSEYMFTDISAGFFPSAKQHLQSFAGIEYQVLDISSDPTAQGFPEEKYDLIVAANVLHATPFLSETLHNVHKLLKPGGKLLFPELFPEGIYISYIMGIIPGWWIGDRDNRPNQPFVSPSRWDRELKATGFTGTDVVVPDQEFPYHKTGILISTKKPQSKPPEDVNLLCHHESSPVVQKAKSAFSKAGRPVHLCVYGSHKMSQGGIVSLLETEEPFFSVMTEGKWRTFQRLLSDVDECGVFWVTKETQIQCHDPDYGLTLGVARSVRSELAVEMATFEAQSFDDGFADAMLMAYDNFRGRHGETDNREYEYLYRDGKVHVPRFHSVVAENEVSAKRLQSMDARMLSIGVSGSLSSLFWKPVACEPPRDGQVVVDIQYTGLNFRDLLQALGAFGENVEFGIEAAGTVSQACPSSGLDVGQRVVVMAAHGLLATRVVVASRNCVPIPHSISLEEAAALSCVYSTVILALMHHGNLRKGQTILIHSACRGIGLAAISLSIMQGADIYATVGSEAKAEYLTGRFGIPRNKIFTSRDSSFHSGLMRATDGQGVDIVLNSLAGELLHASWECVAKFGKMIEIGKRDIVGNGSLRLAPFLHNRSFICVSMDEIMTEQPELNHQLISDAFRYIEEGLIETIEPIRKFPASQAEEAFRHMQGGKHIGKVLVQMPASLSDLPQATKADPPRFSPDAAYILTGGLGGIGRFVCRWMADNGARELVCLSRTSPSSNGDFVSEMEAQGCQLTLVQGNVAIEDEVRVALKSCKKPLKGVLHMAMVLRDRPITEMSYDEWNAPQEPKVSGTWSLHRALQGIDLDSFTLFSSTSGICGQLGQISYSAGNTFLDAFVRYRHSMDLPAAVIDLGVVGNIGRLVDTEDRKLLETTLRGFKMIGEKEIFRAIEVATMRQKPDKDSDRYSSHGQFAIGLTPPTEENPHHKNSLLHGDMRMNLLEPALRRAQLVRDEASGVQKLFNAMSEDPKFSESDEALTLVQNEVIHRLSCLSGSNEQEIGLRQPFAQLGLDSLVLVELRIWIQRTFHIAATVPEIMGTGHVEGLTQLMLSRLRER